MNNIIFSLDNFITMSKNINFLMKDYNINLNFKGYTNTVNLFYNLEIDDNHESWFLQKELLLWESYFSSLIDVLMYIKSDLETIYNQSFVKLSIFHSEIDINIGNTLANKNISIQRYYKKIQILSTYIKELELQRKTVLKAFYQCKLTYKNSLKIYYRA